MVFVVTGTGCTSAVTVNLHLCTTKFAMHEPPLTMIKILMKTILLITITIPAVMIIIIR